MNNRNGNILLESIISISLILLGLVSAFNLVSNSLRENKNVSLKATATYLAAEGIEVTKNIIDTDVQSPDNTWLQTVLDNYESVLFEVAYDSTAPSFIADISTAHLVIDKTTGVFRYAMPGDESNETVSPFSRTISITRISEPTSLEESILVISTVEWLERRTPRKVSLETIFTNWRSD